MSRADRWVRRWWAGEAGAPGRAAAVLAAPLEAGFRAGVRLRDLGFAGGWIGTDAVPVPVVSVGNLTLGGAGKTPFTGWLVRRLGVWGRHPAVVLRGYGADEVELHREWNPSVPVFRTARRVDGAREAVAAGCDVVVLDDGFQHRHLRRDLDLVLVAAESWTPTPRLLPRGPWRESPRALGRAGIVVVTRKSASSEVAARAEAEIRSLHPGIQTARCSIHPSRVVSLDGAREMPVEALGGRPVLAVAALAEPEPFLDHLRHAEVEAALFRDHHPFDGGEAGELLRRAGGRTIVMTAKDAVKLRKHLPSTADAWIVEQGIEIEGGGAALDAALRRALTNRTP